MTNIAETEAKFKQAGVPAEFYTTDGGLGAGECVGLERTEPVWTIYYSERGQKTLLEKATDEDGACKALTRHVDRMMRESGRGGIV